MGDRWTEDYGFGDADRRLMSFLASKLSPARVRHSLGTWDAARRLVQRYQVSVDPNSLAQAALLHDCARELPEEQLKSFGVGSSWSVGLVHGSAGAEMVRRELGVVDESVLEAIEYHTTGRPGGGALLSLVLAADYLDEGRRTAPSSKDWTERSRCQEEAVSLEDLCRRIIGQKLSWCLRRGLWVAPIAVAAYNWYLEGSP